MKKQISISVLVAAISLGTMAGEELTGGHGSEDHEAHASSSPPAGHESAAHGESLASKATNPVGDMIQVQNQFQYSGNVYNMDGYTQVGIVQPVIPVDLPFKWMPKMITRTTVPYIRSPDLPGVGTQSGLGDTVLLAFGLPEFGLKGQMIGFGPALSFPTATEDELGSEQWSAGPAMVYVDLRTKGQMTGFMFYGLWNFAGEDDRENVAQFNIQPIFNKFFPGGWYAGIQDVPWTYNDTTDKWTLPIGARLGKVVHFGKQAVNIFGAAYYNPVDDNPGAAEWTAKLSVSFLFPE